MKKTLDGMTLEELWELFPIKLTEHNDEWQDWYKEEEKRLRTFLPMNLISRISHIGSTSVNTIWAKPTVDIMVELKSKCSIKEIKNIIIRNGYTCMSESDDRISFNRGYTIDGFADRVFHLHLRYVGDNDELYFRDYLMDNTGVAKEYEKLKLELWKKYEHNRDAYTDSKTDFIKKHTEKAKVLYKDRYI